MPDDKTYNGWSNYETWVVKLWMDNDAASYRHMREQAQEAWDSAQASKSFTRKERAELDLADTLKEDHEEAMSQVEGAQGNVFSDLLGAALSEVNWMEIAKSILNDEEFKEDAHDS